MIPNHIKVCCATDIEAGEKDFYKYKDEYLDIPANSTIIDLASNYITTIPDTAMDYLTALEELTLRDNELTGLTFLGAVKATLKTLNLATNPLKIIPDDAFQGFDVLWSLRLDDCELEKMPNLTDIGDTLSYLHLRDNPLLGDQDKKDLTPLISLKQLYLRNTGLTTVPDLTSLITWYGVH